MVQHKVKTLMVASGGQHTLFLSQDNDVFACGTNDNGQLGLAAEEKEGQKTPRRLNYFVEKVITYIAAGSKHSVALTVEGYVFTWGANDKA